MTKGNKKRQLVVLTEEGPNDGLVGSINYALDRAGANQNLSLSEVAQPCAHSVFGSTAIGWYYDLPLGGKYSRIVCAISSPSVQGSFIDSIFYDMEFGQLPEPNDEPFLGLELTKNSLKDSGNMSTQRGTKFYPFQERYPNAECCYYIHTSTPIVKVPPSHERAFRRMLTCGVDVVFGTNKGFQTYGGSPYKSVREFVQVGTSPIAKTNFINELRDGTIEIQTNLNKNGKLLHDPNIGWTSSALWTLSCLNHRNHVYITKHNIAPPVLMKSFASNNPSKLVKVAIDLASKFESITFDGIGLVKSRANIYSGNYWKYANTGEKIGSIQQEIELLNKGYRTLFSNHAGCEKSFLVTPSNPTVTLPKGSNYGIPDLVMEHPNGKDILVIEAEQSQNYNNGCKQINERKFKNTIHEIKNNYYPNHYFKTYVTTFGASCLNRKNVLAETLSDGTTTFDFAKKPAYII